MMPNTFRHDHRPNAMLGCCRLLFICCVYLPARIISAETGLLLPVGLPDSVEALAYIDDLSAAIQWQHAHGGADYGDLTECFGFDIKQWDHHGISAIRLQLAPANGQSEPALIGIAENMEGTRLLLSFLSDPSAEQRDGTGENDLRIHTYKLSGTNGKRFSWGRSGHSVVISPSPACVRQLLTAIASSREDESDSFATLAADYQNSLKQWTDKEFQILWHFRPSALMRSPADQDNTTRYGIDALSAIGSITFFARGQLLGSTFRVAGQAPYQGLAGLFELQPTESITIPEWLFESKTGGIVLHADIPSCLSHFGVLFDDLYAEGIAGTYDELLLDIQDPDGLGLDLPSDLFECLGPCVYLSHAASADGSQQPTLIAFEIVADKIASVADVVRRMMEDDPEVNQKKVEDLAYPIWRYPVDAQHWGGIMVVDSYLTFCTDDQMLCNLARRSIASAQTDVPKRRFGPPAEGPFREKYPGGVIVAASQSGPDRSEPATRSPALDPFFFGPSNFLPGRGSEPIMNTQLLSELAKPLLQSIPNASGWCFPDQQGWLFVIEPSTEN
jgi:hypothetical protein